MGEERIRLIHGDCLERLTELPDDSVHSIVTDPPYGLSFMGKKWDYDVPSMQVWEQCLRVLKPGGHLLAFAGTRTQHRMAVNIEDAGFEIRDMIAWVYGSGFPKSHDVSKAIDKRGGSIPWQAEFAEHLRAVKPAGLRVAEINTHVANGSKSNFWGHFTDTKCQPLLPTLEQYRKLRELLPIDPAWDEHFLPEAEREVVGFQSRGSSVNTSFMSGGNNITAPATDEAKKWQGWGTALKPALEPITVARKPFKGTVASNVLEHGTGAINVDGCRVGTEAIVTQGGDKFPKLYGHYKTAERSEHIGRFPANLIHDGSEEPTSLLDDAARFFYCAKASKADRDEGLEELPLRDVHRYGAGIGEGLDPNAPAQNRNHHPTVKPTKLMQYLVRLVTPPDGIVLDPFMGSGSTGKACAIEGFRFIGIEREAEYIDIARARIKAKKDLFS